MSYRIEWEQDAKQALDQLDIPIIHAILKRINWLSVNFDNIKPKRLTEIAEKCPSDFFSKATPPRRGEGVAAENRVFQRSITGRLKGDFRLRAGGYRVIYSVNRKSKVLIIRLVGHRSDVYRQ